MIQKGCAPAASEPELAGDVVGVHPRSVGIRTDPRDLRGAAFSEPLQVPASAGCAPQKQSAA
jgi:hypothetical protein